MKSIRTIYNNLTEKLLPARSHTLIGLDIKPTYIALAEIRHNISAYKNKLELVSYAFTPISYQEENYPNKNAIQKAITNAIAQTKPSTQKTVIALPYSMIIAKTIVLNHKLKPNEIETLLRLNSVKYFGADEKILTFDYRVINNKITKQQTIHVIAAQKENAIKYATFLSDAKLSLTAIDVDIYALARAALLIYPERAASRLMIVNLDSEKILFGIIEKTQLDDTSIKEIFIPEKAKETPQTMAHFILEQLSTINQISRDKHESILLCGAYTSTTLANILTQEIKIPVIIANPFRHIMPAINSHSNKSIKPKCEGYINVVPNMMLCFGLALHGINHNKRTLWKNEHYDSA